MILATQICLMILLFYILWCEYSPFFKDTLTSVSLRLTTSVLILTVCYHAPKLNNYPYYTQFLVLLSAITVLIFSLKVILKKYNIAKARHDKVEMLRSLRGFKDTV